MRKPIWWGILVVLSFVLCMGCATAPAPLPKAAPLATTFQKVDPSNSSLMAARTFQRADRLKLTRP